MEFFVRYPNHTQIVGKILKQMVIDFGLVSRFVTDINCKLIENILFIIKLKFSINKNIALI